MSAKRKPKPEPIPDRQLVMHIWLPGGGSLCKLGDWPTEGTVFEAACSTCLLLVGTLRRDAAALLASELPMQPITPTQAWRQLEGTLWETRFPGVGKFGGAKIDVETNFNAPLLALDPKLKP